MQEKIFAIIHLTSLPLGVAVLMLRAHALHLAEAPHQLKRVFYWDNWYALIAVFWIGSGLYRAFGGLEKGTAYYLANHAFWTKMLLLLVLLGAESVVMMALIRYRIRLARGQAVTIERKRTLILHHWIELWAIVGMVAVAVLMARGVGTSSTRSTAPLTRVTDDTGVSSSTPIDLARGERIFRTRCVMCHGEDGRGYEGRLAVDFHQQPSRLQKSEATLMKSVRDGIRGSGMRGYGADLGETDVRNVVAFIKHHFRAGS
ncbi:MAG TPA: DUF2214 family protein [Polyangiaceae bacterium]|nr:DUF2214 family protein [Polyangiaceae bacterium]